MLDFLRASSTTSYQDEYENGGDGTLVAEFRAMEYFHRLSIEENSYSNSEESFACSVLASHYMTCLDLAGPGTFTGNSESPAINWDMQADEVNYRNVSAVYVNQSLSNLFGIGCGSSSFSTVENTGRHGDGVVNSLDIGVLVFSINVRNTRYNSVKTQTNICIVDPSRLDQVTVNGLSKNSKTKNVEINTPLLFKKMPIDNNVQKSPEKKSPEKKNRCLNVRNYHRADEAGERGRSGQSKWWR